MSFGSRLKERREALGITQPQLAKMLDVSKGAIGNYETDLNSPRATILYKIFEILNCDANYLFQDEMRALAFQETATPEEFENIIKKYRQLNAHGREVVDMVLDAEWANSVNSKKIIQLNAAHGRTDIDPSDALHKHDDEIMDNSDF